MWGRCEKSEKKKLFCFISCVDIKERMRLQEDRHQDEKNGPKEAEQESKEAGD